MAEILKTYGPLVVLVLTVGGGLAGIDSFYARRSTVEAQFQTYDQRFANIRLNDVEYQIVQLENTRRVRRLTPIEEDLLRRLYNERRILLCQLRIQC